VRDTFVYVEAILGRAGNEIRIRGSVGKAVGEVNEKRIDLKGPLGVVSLEFEPNPEIYFSDSGGRRLALGRPEDGYSTFLGALCEGRLIEMPVGIIPLKKAVQNLKILEDVQDRSMVIRAYEPGASKEEIIERIERL